jgi:hypothetical protein
LNATRSTTSGRREQIVAEAAKPLGEAGAIKSATLATARSFVSAAKTLLAEDLLPDARLAFQAVLGLKREAEAIRPRERSNDATQFAFSRCSNMRVRSDARRCSRTRGERRAVALAA